MKAKVPPMKFEPAIVPAPKCDDCNAKLVAFDSVRWKCETPTCKSVGLPVSVDGVYPFFIADCVMEVKKK